MMEKKIVMSGIRPTGFLHLGNYFGAIRNFVRMQDEYECFFMVADWHSLTTHPDTKELRNSVIRVVAEHLACGLDPNKVALYCQSQVHETAELYLYLNMMAYKGELEKTVTFKEKVRQHPDNVNAGLLTSPGFACTSGQGPGTTPGNGAHLRQQVQSPLWADFSRTKRV